MSQQLQLRENVPLGPLTTLGVGGTARFFTLAETEDQLREAFCLADAQGLDVFVLGGGSNIVVSDSGFDGLVIQIGLTGKTEETLENGKVRITFQAGESWDDLVAYCVANDLQGIECMSGIPGFVGGTPVQNVGAYGQEVSETIESVRVFDRQSKQLRDLSNADCGFFYRTSIFNTSEKDRYVVLSVTYLLNPGGAPKITYKDLKEFFGSKIPSLSATREAVLGIRRAKSMVIDPEDPNSRSAGSFFKNPVVSRANYAAAVEKAIVQGIERVPFFEVDENSVKIPAAWLIEKSGFKKGFKHGTVGISSNHTLALVNLGGGTATEILELAGIIKQGVSATFEIQIFPEPLIIGKF